MYICVTEVDAQTKIPCTEQAQRTGPSMPAVKGLKLDWADKSTWPITTNAQGVYDRAPKYYGTCDDDADTSIAGVLEVLTEQEYFLRKQAEFQARKPFPSWLWDEDHGSWVPPIPIDATMNEDNVRWDEETTSWVPL
jgi:hypothetical protein